MSEHVEQNHGTLRVTIEEAAAWLGVSEAALRKHIRRGSLEEERGEDGRVYVYLDLSQETLHTELWGGRDPLVEELIEELRDRVAFLERSLERRSVEDERYQRIIASPTQADNHLAARLREIEASRGAKPRPNPESSQAAIDTLSRCSWWQEFFGFG